MNKLILTISLPKEIKTSLKIRFQQAKAKISVQALKSYIFIMEDYFRHFLLVPFSHGVVSTMALLRYKPHTLQPVYLKYASQ